MSFCRLTKGITPKICRLWVYVIINKRSFGSFMYVDPVCQSTIANCQGALSQKQVANVPSHPRSHITSGDKLVLCDSVFLPRCVFSLITAPRRQWKPTKQGEKKEEKNPKLATENSGCNLSDSLYPERERICLS